MAGMEAQVAEALRTELERQAETTEGLSVTRSDGGLAINGTIDLEALAMAAVGSVAGGP
ncbi:hypothetical protein GGQ87_000209 [Brevundimonas alba]|uniref:Uncharacterized protein n=1 Tax=Brevundimonas alba TaxID=74314 RepID=A0A7X6BN04_9CAUL|nr:hypothetical protein [Brevundimonas alba]NJC39951.1 hypothetical protein [Brevundimonas alba]